jgi:hypothetical protein
MRKMKRRRKVEEIVEGMEVWVMVWIEEEVGDDRTMEEYERKKKRVQRGMGTKKKMRGAKKKMK